MVWWHALSIRQDIMDWLEEAKADLRHAENSMSAGDYNWVCFAAQQAAEKAFKALIMLIRRKRPPHVHDLTMLHNELKTELPLPNEVVENLGELSSYYTIPRYPNAGLTRPSIGITSAQGERAVKIARKVVEAVEDIVTRRARRKTP